MADKTIAAATNATAPKTVAGASVGARAPAATPSPGAGSTTATTGLQELRGDQLDWPGRQATNAQALRITAALSPPSPDLLTPAQSRLVSSAIEQRSGAVLLATPRLTVMSGQQAQILVGQVHQTVTGVNPEALVKTNDVAEPGPDVPTFLTDLIPVGASLDLLPTVAEDGQTIELKVVATLTHYLGQEPPAEGDKVRVWQKGRQKWVEPSAARFQVRQIRAQTRVGNGQTLILGSPALALGDSQEFKSKVAVLGDIPLLGRLFRRESKSPVKSQLLVLITPTIAEPGGSRPSGLP